MAYRGEYDRERYNREDDWRRNRPGDRGFFDRAGDEVRSWFGDEEAERRRRRDEAREHGDRSWDRYSGGRYRSERDPERYGGSESRYSSREHYTGGSPEWNRDWGRSGNQESYRSRNLGASWGGADSGREEWRGYGWMGSARERGPYYGRGPSGYQRSDERIREDINERLTEHPYLDATNIRVEVSNGEARLEGHVDNRDAKRMAEDVAEGVLGVKDVQNHIRVGSEQTTR